MNKKLLSTLLGGVMLLSGTALAGCTISKDETTSATWYHGVESPKSTTGKQNDYYFETDTCDVWFYGEDGWTIISNLKGATGETGAQGEKGEDAETPEFVIEKEYKLTTSYVLYSDTNYPFFDQGTFTETFCASMTYDSCIIKVKKDIVTVEWTQTNDTDTAIAKIYFKVNESEKTSPTFNYDSYEVYLNDVLITDLSNETLNNCMNISVLNVALSTFNLGESFLQIVTQGAYVVSNFCIIDRENHHSYYIAQTYGF